MSNSLIISLAFLKVNCDTNRNGYLDNFVPLVAECLRESSNNVVSTNELQKNLQDRFGICIPLHVISSLLTRAKKREYVFVKNHIYYRNEEKLCDLSFQSNQAKIQRIYTALIEDFQKFNKVKYCKEISELTAEQIILSFLSYNQVKIFQGNHDFKVLPDYPQLFPEDKVIIADYITTAQASNPQIYEYIETIVKGYMIVNALYLPDAHNSNKKFRKTKIFFDTSFIIYALGYSGNEMCVPCTELMDLLYTSGAELYCFRHTLDEIKGILNACSNRLGHFDDTVFGRSVHFFTSHGFTASDIQLLISTLERKVEALRIHVVDKPDYNEHQFVISEEKLTDLLKGKVRYPREGALNRDVDSIASIYRIRRGQSFFGIEESRAIFVTPNNSLAQAINEFYYTDHDTSTISPCITDFTLTNIVWLKTPTKAPNLPMKRVIADCYASIQPDDALMGRWIREIEKLNKKGDLSAEDYYFIRFSDEARRALVEYSLGNPDVISEGTIPEILQRAKRIITEEAEQRLTQSQIDLSDEITRREAVEKEIAQISQSNNHKEIDRLSRIKYRANKLAKIFAISLRFLSFIFLIAGLLISLPFDLLGLKDLSIAIQSFPRFILPCLIAIMLVLNFVNQFWGVSLNAFINNIEVIIGNKIFSILKSLTE